MQEAHDLLDAFLVSLVNVTGHWYAPMLDEDHDSGFCQLADLTKEECSNQVLEAPGLMKKYGQQNECCFQHSVFQHFLAQPVSSTSVS